MDKFEKLVKEIMAEAEADGEPITREEAEEMAKMELGAKEIKRYEQAKVEKVKKPRERKIDEEKLFILETIAEELENRLGLDNEPMDIHLENEVKLHFNYNGSSYSLNLVKHRPPKK